MRLDIAARRTRSLHLGVPAAVLGALASSMAAGPAVADTAATTTAATTQPIERLHGAGHIVPMESAPSTYVVQAGDTVAAIAGRFGLRTVDVLTANGLSWRSVIYPGQTLALGNTTPAAPAPAPAPAPAAASFHTVTAGDTVFALAQKYGTTVDTILAANGLTRASVIYPGQQLAVAGGAASAAPAAPAPAASAPAAAPVAGASHAVVAGDTVFAIAQKYGTTTQAIFALNGLAAGSIIYPGQTLVVAAAPAPAAAPSTPIAASQNGQLQATLTAEQSANADLIVRIGRELGVSDRGVAIALATAMVESGMRNLDWGDRDSLGIFQQRPSTGWGAPEQILDADRSTRVFYGGQSDPNGSNTRGLLDIAGWESMAFTDAAQAVQISAFPQRYGQWETQAYAWLSQHG